MDASIASLMYAGGRSCRCIVRPLGSAHNIGLSSFQPVSLAARPMALKGPRPALILAWSGLGVVQASCSCLEV